MLHLGYTSRLCLRCEQWTNHRLLIWDKVKGNKDKVQRICCVCHPEHKPTDKPVITVPR